MPVLVYLDKTTLVFSKGTFFYDIVKFLCVDLFVHPVPRTPYLVPFCLLFLFCSSCSSKLYTLLSNLYHNILRLCADSEFSAPDAEAAGNVDVGVFSV